MEYDEITPENITGAQMDTLIALIERGPVEDGNLPSKSARDQLILSGDAARCVVQCSQGFQVATYKGSLLYMKIFGNSNTLREARAFRLAKRAINNAQ